MENTIAVTGQKWETHRELIGDQNLYTLNRSGITIFIVFPFDITAIG